MPREITEVTVAEDGTETHESWIRLVTSKPSSTPGARLFDSEIPHMHYVSVSIFRCWRRRDLNRDWKHNTELLLECDMSQAQWGAFVSSFGDGGGVPATLRFLTGVGPIPQAPAESRLAESHREVREAGTQALDEIRDAYAEVEEAFETGGKKAMREAIRTLGFRIENAPSNMEFAAKSLTEHAENVVTKARADIEGMVLDAQAQGRTLGTGAMPLLTEGDS